jgi:serine/threonine protein kinase
MPSTDEFLKTVLRSGLLDRQQLQTALRKVPRAQRDDSKALADHLVKTGKLSRFQARKLLGGAAFGLKLGHFQVLAPIGKGGMGTVYLARDTRSEMLLALKILPPKKAREEDRRLARFRREMELCQRVAHPNIAWTLEVGVSQGVYYIAMEYIPGKSLFRVVTEGGPLDVSRAARLFGEVASALEHAHTQGLVHRDLKPSNILITPNDHAKVLDLGLALVQGEDAADKRVVGGHGYVVGTMDYIAPEQADDASKAGPHSDIYSLGGTLYFALTGRTPFPGGTPLEKMQNHRTQEPVPIEQLNPAIPPELAAMVRKMMAKRPENRFASAEQLRDELSRWFKGEQLPMDQQGDQGFLEAVAVLEASDLPSELLTTPLASPSSVPDKLSSEVLAVRALGYSSNPGWLWWIAAAIVVGIVLLVLLILVLVNW